MNRFVAAAALAAVGVSAPCVAQQGMTHEEAVTFSQWRTKVQQELARHLRYPHFMGGQQPATGIVRVKFNCSESGRPDKVTIAKSSGSGQLDRAALSAVSKIATLHPLPREFAQGQAYQAMVMFDSTLRDGYDARLRKMSDEADQVNARFDHPQIASVGVASATGTN